MTPPASNADGASFSLPSSTAMGSAQRRLATRLRQVQRHERVPPDAGAAPPYRDRISASSDPLLGDLPAPPRVTRHASHSQAFSQGSRPPTGFCA